MILINERERIYFFVFVRENQVLINIQVNYVVIILCILNFFTQQIN
jgi:hypothetical protein